jgi:hypothetical protein
LNRNGEVWDVGSAVGVTVTLVDKTICDGVVVEVLEVVDGGECVKEVLVNEPEDVGMIKSREGEGTTVK